MQLQDEFGEPGDEQCPPKVCSNSNFLLFDLHYILLKKLTVSSNFKQKSHAQSSSSATRSVQDEHQSTLAAVTTGTQQSTTESSIVKGATIKDDCTPKDSDGKPKLRVKQRTLKAAVNEELAAEKHAEANLRRSRRMVRQQMKDWQEANQLRIVITLICISMTSKF